MALTSTALTGRAAFPAAPPGETNSMHEHGPISLEGPIRGTTAWWRGLEPSPEPTAAPDPTNRNDDTKENGIRSESIRKELVERVRREIAAGTYDTPEKWDAALDRLLERL